MWLSKEELNKLLAGKTVQKIFINDEYLKFETDDGDVCFTVEGDCCSHSYFHDFIGVEKLLNNKITEVEEVDLGEIKTKDEYDCIQAYGFRFVTEGLFGEQSSVLSFRNSSNGYYGGSMEFVESIPADAKLKRIGTDWLND